MTPRLRHLTLPLALALLAGCAVGPVYQPPGNAALGVPDSWQGHAPEKVTADNLAQWWTLLGDAQLTALVQDAVARNPDLDSARASLRAARARVSASEASRLPTLSASASASQSKRGNAATTDTYDVGFDAAWEPDLFGGTRHAVDAARADTAAVEATLANAQVSLAAETALNYVQYRALQARILTLQRNLASQQETLDLTRWRTQAGLVSPINLEQSTATTEQSRAQLPVLQASLAAAANRLAILTGRAPGALEQQLSDSAPLPALPDRLVIGIPADTLRQRPDVIAAERKLAAETARTGVATANRYPSLRLSGSLGLDALSAGALGESGSLYRSLTAGLTAPLFDGGKLKQQQAVQQAVQDQAYAAYRSTVLTALEDVENALTNFSAQRQRLQSLQTAAEAAGRADAMAKQNYQAGLADFQTVLDAQRSRLSLEDSQISCEADLVTALVQLYKALGGGWTAPATTSTPSVSGNPS